MTDARIAELEKLGFKRWTKGGVDRLYISASSLGLDCTYYKTGNVSYAEFKGSRVSNCEARRMKNTSCYININTEKVICSNDLMKEEAERLFESTAEEGKEE